MYWWNTAAEINNVLKNCNDRVGYCMASRGSHLNEIVFHYQPEGLYLKKKKRNLRKYSVVFFKAFSKKKVFGGPYTTLMFFLWIASYFTRQHHLQVINMHAFDVHKLLIYEPIREYFKLLLNTFRYYGESSSSSVCHDIPHSVEVHLPCD